MMKWLFRRLFLLRFDLFILGFYFLTIFFLVVKVPFYVDIKSHNLLLVEYLKEGLFPFPPGYYLLVYLLDLLIRVKYPFVASSAIILTLFFWWKYRIIHLWCKSSFPEVREDRIFLFVFSFLLLSPIYIPSIDGTLWYLGKFTQTIWHNSTLIFVFPFCLLLIKLTLRWINSGEIKMMIPIGIFCLGILLIKPSFLFAYIPTLPIYLGFRDKKFSKQTVQSIALVTILFLLLLVEKYLIFNWDPMLPELYSEVERSEVVFRPFRVWAHYSNELFFDFITSFPLVIAYLFLWRNKAFDSRLFSFSIISLCFALAIFLLFAETGFREFHGNFYWQIPISLFLCHFAIVLKVFRDFLNMGRNLNTKVFTMFFVYALQVILGIGYWLRIFTDFIVS